MLAFDVRHLELGIVTALTAVLAAVAVPRNTPASAPGMPAPSPEPVAVRHTEVASIACDEPGIQTVVLTGRVHSRDVTTLFIHFAELPAGYTVMTGAKGDFEIRIPRTELGVTDLCALPTAGRQTEFNDASLSIEYAMQFER